jgi:hypothetical protein
MHYTKWVCVLKMENFMKNLILAVSMIVFSVGVNAACTRANLTGKWVTYSTGSNTIATECILTIPSKGHPISASCAGINGVSYTATGDFGFTNDCRFICNLANTNGNILFYSYVNNTKNAITGMWGANSGNIFSNGSFNAVKI